MRRLIPLLALLTAPAFAAEPTPSVTFGASVTNANGSLSTRLTWATTPTANSCTASGHPSWTGTRAPSGAVDLPAITLSGTYQLTLTCQWAGDTTATLTWTAPTTNTDGSAYTNPGGYRVYRGATASAAQSATTPDRVLTNPATLTTAYTGLAAGQHCFAVTAINAATPAVESAKTPSGCKTASVAVAQSSSVSLTVNPIPNAPASLAVQ